ncbi:MAG: cytidine deaminase [Thermotogota bacterium]|nr:cytidine deaminase [Thermotogota bacterium]
MNKKKILIEKARSVLKNSYSPYSNLKVAAALLTDDGTIFTGVNVENSSIGLSMCAERSAMVSAVSAGYRSFAAIAITSNRKDPISPCGACRQFMAEFGDFEVFLVGEGKTINTTVFELLPMRFEME